MNISHTSDAVFEALFRQAVIDSFYEDLGSLPPDEILAKQYTFSPAHEMRMEKLFEKEALLERLRTAAKWGRRVAAVITIVATVLFGSLMLVPQVRATVVQTFIEWYEKFTMFTSDSSETEKTNLEPQYIPAGFVEIVREEMAMMTAIIYLSEDEGTLIKFQSALSSGVTSVDNEMVEYSVLTIYGIEYHVFTSTEADDENSIVWDKHDQRYAIISTISTDELIKMAISVEK